MPGNVDKPPSTSAPYKYFYFFYVDKVDSTHFKIDAKGQLTYGGYIYDTGSNGVGDSKSQLGDVTTDTYKYTTNQAGAQNVLSGKFIGGTADKQSFVGYYKRGSVRGYYFYTATPGNYTYGQIITVAPANQVALCFASGTRIRTCAGDVAVEDLDVGDKVVTASGAHRPIRWLGHRHVDFTAHGMRSDMQPVRILAGAFGAGMPARDLYVSPGHPILVGADEDGEGGHLVPAMCLINGTTIDRVKVDSITYWHVELDAHDILLAEGLPAESYLDWGDRAFFSEAEAHALMNPDFVVPGLAGRCRPVAIDGPVVEAERRRLDGVFALRLAMACAWPEGDTLGI